MAPKQPHKKQWLVYLLKCSDGSLYCGVTTDLDARIRMHNAGRASKYTRARLPVVCVAQSPMMTKSQAFRLEYQTKRLPAEKKIAHVCGQKAALGAAGRQ